MKTTGSLPLLLALALAGCVAEPGPPVASDPFAALQKNMSAAQVEALVGEPAEIKPFKAKGLACEIWVYRRKISETVQPLPIGTREVPATNPLTGQSITVTESIYENQFETVIETIELLMVEQRVIEWKRHRLTERVIR